MNCRYFLPFIFLFIISWSQAYTSIHEEKFYNYDKEFKVLKFISKNKKIQKVTQKSEYEYGPVQIGPGAPVIAKAIIGIKRKKIYIENNEYILEELQIGKRLGVYFNLGGSQFSYWKIRVLYTIEQADKKRNTNIIINSLLYPDKKQEYARVEISHYLGNDLIAGIETPKYVFNFYNLALRSNFIKKNFLKQTFHKNKKSYTKYSSGFSNEYLGRFFSELYGIDQNHIFNNSEDNYSSIRNLPFPKDPRYKNLGFLFSNLKRGKLKIKRNNEKIPSMSVLNEKLRIKKASLFGIISKKWMNNYLDENSKNTNQKVISKSEKSNWTNFFRRETHSLYIGILKTPTDCNALVNIGLKDSKLTKKEKKLYRENYNVGFNKNETGPFVANKQIIFNKDGVKKITGLECSEQNSKKLIKTIRKLIPKKLHDYNITKIRKSINEKLDKTDYSSFTYTKLANKFSSKTRVGFYLDTYGFLNQLKINFSTQY
tara:strand:- start:2647 stop:4098 length:1452 start_codon:yes stop_codon:yes gene_type:complete